MADTFYSKAQRVLVSFGLIVSAIILLDQATVTAKPLCKPGFYYDEVTGNCDHCSDICDQAETMDTVTECERKCPEYRNKEHKCPPRQYYDASVDRCDSCDTLCLHAEIRGEENECRSLCPDWSEMKMQSTETNQNGTDSEETDKGIARAPILNIDVTNILVSVLVLVGSLLLAFLATAVVLWYKKQQAEGNDKHCNKRPFPEEQEESSEYESLTGRGDPLCHPQTEDG